jgi:hypothetical protein
LLPPGWRAMNGRPLAQIAAWQWERTNAQILDDLQPLGGERWAVLQYDDLLRDPAVTIGKLCEFLRLPVDSALVERLSAPLPPSRYTLTQPAADKWRANEAQIAPVLPPVQVTWDRLRALG